MKLESLDTPRSLDRSSRSLDPAPRTLEATSTFELFEMPSTAVVYRALYDELDGEVITLDLDDDEL